jgi:flavodoxin
MKSLVIFYSRSGNTRIIAHAIADSSKSDIEEIIDKKKRLGRFGFLSAGKDATFRKLTKIDDVKNDPLKYDLIILGTPVWNGKMAPAIRTYIKEFKDKIKKVAFFVTADGSVRGTFNDLIETIEKEPVAKLEVLKDEIKNDAFNTKIEEFLKSFI